jgi:hypothetical protein
MIGALFAVSSAAVNGGYPDMSAGVKRGIMNIHV